jgi:hypothetical protein
MTLHYMQGGVNQQNFEGKYGQSHRAVFIFPGNTGHHGPHHNLYSHKSGGGLGVPAGVLGKAGHPVLSLPTTGMENYDNDPRVQQIAKDAIADLWRVIGNGMDIVLPVRNHDANSKFFKGSLPGAAGLEPNFWGKNNLTPNPNLAQFYLDEIDKIHQHLENGGPIPPEFKAAYDEGVAAKAAPSPWFTKQQKQPAQQENEKRQQQKPVQQQRPSHEQKEAQEHAGQEQKQKPDQEEADQQQQEQSDNGVLAETLDYDKAVARLDLALKGKGVELVIKDNESTFAMGNTPITVSRSPEDKAQFKAPSLEDEEHAKNLIEATLLSTATRPIHLSLMGSEKVQESLHACITKDYPNDIKITGPAKFVPQQQSQQDDTAEEPTPPPMRLS